MLADAPSLRWSRAQKVKAEDRPIVIFPQGTRTAVGRYLPYRVGVAVLYKELNVPIVPMALNSGVYWARRSFRKHSGRIVVEFLPPIQPGLSRDAVMAELKSQTGSGKRPAGDRGGRTADRQAIQAAA